MRKSRFLATVGAAALALGMTVPAYALIDFTDGSWSAAPSQTIGGVTVTLTAFNSTNTVVPFTETSFDGDSTQCSPLGLSCNSDGIGIADDEVTYGIGDKEEVERLLVTFSEAIDIAAIIFLDTFLSSSTDPVAEMPEAQFNDTGPVGVFTATATDGTGFLVGTPGNGLLDLSVASNWLGVTQIELFANSSPFQTSANTDFALAGISLVPIPAALPLLGTALAALVVVGRRRRKQLLAAA